MARSAKTNKLRIGIYAGTFDPVHAGHIAMALQALEKGNLDQVVFLPERQPRHKPGVEHYAHRIAMLKNAAAPHPKLAVMEVVDRHFTVRRTLPLLQSVFAGAQLVLVMGSDAVETIPMWPLAERLLLSTELVVGVRDGQRATALQRLINQWSLPQPQALTMFESYAPHVSSRHIRQALQRGETAQGLLTSVHRYARAEWLYVSPAYAAAAGS